MAATRHSDGAASPRRLCRPQNNRGISSVECLSQQYSPLMLLRFCFMDLPVRIHASPCSGSVRVGRRLPGTSAFVLISIVDVRLMDLLQFLHQPFCLSAQQTGRSLRHW